MSSGAEQQAAARAHDESMAAASVLAGSKRKEMEEQPKKKSFKAIGNLVLAMRRFSNSINPTYTYGKRTTSLSSGGGSKTVTEDKEAVSSGRPTSSEGEQYAYTDHGHRFDFLLKPLPPTEDEEVATAPTGAYK